MADRIEEAHYLLAKDFDVEEIHYVAQAYLDAQWPEVKLEDIVRYDVIRAVSQSRFRPHIVFEGRIFPSTGGLSGLRMELDFAEPTLDSLDAKDYKFYRKPVA